MIYADTDFFLAFLKPTDWLKTRAQEIRDQYGAQITTSEVTFIELLLLAKRFGLDPVKTMSAAMKIAHLTDSSLLKAALNVEKGGNVFDSFRAAHCEGAIISSDDVFDRLFELKRVKLEEDSKK